MCHAPAFTGVGSGQDPPLALVQWSRSLSSETVSPVAPLVGRKAILKKCVDLENELRGPLKVFEIRLPVGLDTDRSMPSCARRCRRTRCSPALVPLLDARTVLYKTYLKLDNAVKGLVRVDPICRRLMSIPGVAAVTALTFKAVVDNPTRFKSFQGCGR